MKEIGKIKDACTVIAGQSPKGTSYNENGEGMEFHQGKKAFGESIIESSNVWTTEITKIAEPGDILMSVRAPVGPTNITDRKICIGRGLAAIRCNKDIIPHYILYALRNIESKIIGNDGAVFNSINKKQIEDLPLPLLSLAEQQSVVDYLDSAFAKIDTMKANAEKALNEAKALFQASLKEMLEPKEGWEEKKLKEVGVTQTGTTPSKQIKAYYGGDIPFIRPAELNIDQNGGIQYDSELKLTEEGALKTRVIKANSVLMCCIGSVGKTGFVLNNVTCNQQINTLTPYENYNPRFVYYALISPIFQQEVIKIANSAKATLPIISKGKWEMLSIPVPPLSEQQSIVATLDSLKSKVDRLQANSDKISQECDALKQSILRQVFE